jgi:hypothetical protein
VLVNNKRMHIQYILQVFNLSNTVLGIESLWMSCHGVLLKKNVNVSTLMNTRI